jgi:hypothetical protein
MTSPEVLVKIKLSINGIIEKRFNTCEEAWAWEKEIKHYHTHRRSIKDRQFVWWSFYVGCTCHGNTYGGYLTGSEYSRGAESLEMSKVSEKYIASKRSNWTYPS